MSEKKASFAAGCFWGVEVRFREIDGVIDAAVGYMGGETDNPDYHQVCSGNTGHAEAVQLLFDDSKVSFAGLLDVFFGLHNPTPRSGRYRTGTHATT
jgi:peptide-methionine (S)-S-oxide reductase